MARLKELQAMYDALTVEEVNRAWKDVQKLDAATQKAIVEELEEWAARKVLMYGRPQSKEWTEAAARGEVMKMMTVEQEVARYPDDEEYQKSAELLKVFSQVLLLTGEARGEDASCIAKEFAKAAAKMPPAEYNTYIGQMHLMKDGYDNGMDALREKEKKQPPKGPNP